MSSLLLKYMDKNLRSGVGFKSFFITSKDDKYNALRDALIKHERPTLKIREDSLKHFDRPESQDIKDIFVLQRGIDEAIRDVSNGEQHVREIFKAVVRYCKAIDAYNVTHPDKPIEIAYGFDYLKYALKRMNAYGKNGICKEKTKDKATGKERETTMEDFIVLAAWNDRESAKGPTIAGHLFYVHRERIGQILKETNINWTSFLEEYAKLEASLTIGKEVIGQPAGEPIQFLKHLLPSDIKAELLGKAAHIYSEILSTLKTAESVLPDNPEKETIVQTAKADIAQKVNEYYIVRAQISKGESFLPGPEDAIDRVFPSERQNPYALPNL